MSQPTPEPGTHLAAVDCNGCGVWVYSVPSYADRAMCTACGREKTGATTPIVSSPPSRMALLEDAARSLHVIDAPAKLPAPANLPYVLRCKKCPRWRAESASMDEIALMARNHHRQFHDPNGWASGVKGGLTGRRGGRG